MEKKIILEKLEEVFYNKTFEEVSMQSIADILEIKKASVYYYFPSKEKLMEEVLVFSFTNYENFINNLPESSLENFINDFIYFPYNSKNLFSIINQKWYCTNENIKEIIKEKNKEVLKSVSKNLIKNYNFSKERAFLLISLLDDISKKRCMYGDCEMSIEDLVTEILIIFK